MSLRIAWKAVVLMTLIGLACAAAGAQEKTTQKMSEAASHLYKASLLYQQKKYDAAAAEVEEAMKLQPTSAEIVELRDQIGEATLIAMLNNPKLRDKVRAILQIAEQETLRRQTDPAEIQKLVKDLESEDFTVYWKAITELVIVGDYAVPYLLQPLCDPTPSHQAALAVVALTRMRHKAVLPLIEALKSDNAYLREDVCAALGAIGDRRAVPALKAICERDPSSVVRSQAANSLKKITGKNPEEIGNAGELYWDLAEKYYAGDYQVLRALVDDIMLVWRWEESDNPKASVVEKLRYYPVPRYMFNRLMAESACYDGMLADPSNQKIIETLVAVYFNAAGEVTSALRGYRTSTLGFKFSEQEIKTLQAMAGVTSAWTKLAEVTGSKYINCALERALKEGNGPMAGACIRSLRAVADSSPHAGVSGLIAALGYPDKFVRYAAAEALLSIAPRGNLGGEAAAMKVISAALTEDARRTVLLVQRNTQFANALKAALRPGDFKIVEAADLNQATTYLRKIFLPVDIIVLEHKIGGADTVSFARRIKTASTTPNTAIIVTTAQDPGEVEKDYGKNADAILNNATAAKEVMDKVQAALAKPGVKMDDKGVVLAVKRSAANAVAQIDPDTTAYPMQYLTPALSALLDEEDETLRTLALTTLGKMGERAANPKIVNIISDKKQSEKLRITALAAMGRIFEHTRKVEPTEYEAVKEALRDPKLSATAADALGKAGLGPKTLSATLSEVRVPMRVIAGGTPPITAPPPAPAAEKKEEGVKESEEGKKKE